VTWLLGITWVAIIATWVVAVLTFRWQVHTRRLLRETRQQLDDAHVEQLRALNEFFQQQQPPS
jgi:hypothetical protein